MHRIFLTLAALVLLCLPAQADEAAIRKVITAQIEAFEADNLRRAFKFASPTIRQTFRTPRRFGEMVRQGFPMVWRPAQVNFLSLRHEGEVMWQDVMIRDQQGALHILEYQMIEMKKGWRINAVRQRKLEGGEA